jgi:hypothetical protein
MKKEIKYVIFLIAAVVLAGLVYFLVSTANKTSVTEMTERPLENVEAADATAEWFPTNENTPPPPADGPVYTKEIELVMMTNEEKKKIGIDTSFKVQVLEKDENGTILAYRVITEDNPVLEKYGN